jgi:hypothetical protein
MGAAAGRIDNNPADKTLTQVASQKARRMVSSSFQA